MKKYNHFSRFMVPVGLSASLCGAPAQADTWVGVGLKPQYKVEAVRFHCNDETGYDEPWFAPWISDEVRVGIGTPAATTISVVFTDVDSGETRGFAPEQSCIYPIDGQSRSGDGVFTPSETWTCSSAGSPGPISFTVVMAEEDSGFWHDCISEFPTCAFYREDQPPDPNDELIGRHTVEFTPEQLAFAMPNVGDLIEPVITLRKPKATSRESVARTLRSTRSPIASPAWPWGPLMSDRAAQPAMPMR
jgi:hypothetical protein